MTAFRLTDETRQQLRELAYETRRSQAQMVAILIEREWKKTEHNGNTTGHSSTPHGAVDGQGK